MGLSRQEYWGGLLFPSPGDLPDPGIEPLFPGSPTLAGGFFATESHGKPQINLFKSDICLYFCVSGYKSMQTGIETGGRVQMTAFYIFSIAM